MTLYAFGILCGFLGAFCQGLNYVFSKDCQSKYNLHGLKQLTAIHLVMLVISLPPFILCGFWQFASPEVFLYMFYMVAPYLAAQYVMIRAFDLSDASIVSPLLTLKIPILALMALLFLGKAFALPQYLAILAIMGLGFYFSSLAGRASLKLILHIIAACTLYAIQDIAMTELTHLLPCPRFEAVFACAVWEYVTAGLLMLCAVPLRHVKPLDVWHAKWVGITWFCATITFLVTFNVNGVVEGNIIQTLRSVVGVIIAYLFYRKYIKDRATFRKKLFITAGMFAAVALYYLP